MQVYTVTCTICIDTQTFFKLLQVSLGSYAVRDSKNAIIMSKVYIYKYKKTTEKWVGMVGPKSTQTRVVGMITDEMHPWL